MNVSTFALIAFISTILYSYSSNVIRNMIVQAYRWPSHLWSLLRLINYRGEESGWLIGTTRILFRLRFFGYHSCRWKQHFPPCPRQQTSPSSHISVHLIIFFGGLYKIQQYSKLLLEHIVTYWVECRCECLISSSLDHQTTHLYNTIWRNKRLLVRVNQLSLVWEKSVLNAKAMNKYEDVSIRGLIKTGIFSWV